MENLTASEQVVADHLPRTYDGIEIGDTITLLDQNTLRPFDIIVDYVAPSSMSDRFDYFIGGSRPKGRRLLATNIKIKNGQIVHWTKPTTV